MKTPAITRLLDALSVPLRQMTVTEAHRLGCCVRCRRDVQLRELDDIDQSEWHLSGLCPSCYAALTPEDGCE